ncbi:MAG TPA: hypothetical protein VF658_10460 [Pyrinomonadaceae bacterium]|jgi:hypothetical protein
MSIDEAKTVSCKGAEQRKTEARKEEADSFLCAFGILFLCAFARNWTSHCHAP